MLNAYIDETGDRGSSGNASPIFGMAAVVVEDTAERAMREALRQLRKDCATPEERPLSWKESLKTHERRKRAAALLSQVTAGVKVIYVCNQKSLAYPGSYVGNPRLFYNYVAYYTLERILRCADNWQGGGQDVNVRFGQVKGFDHQVTQRYFDFKRRGADWYPPPWGRKASLTWVSASQYEMSQVADVYAGFMKASTWPDDFGDTEGSYIQKVWHQIDHASSCVLGKGLKGMPTHQVFTTQPWWPCSCH